MARYSIRSQIAEVRREIDMRRKVYPGRVRSGAMREGEAELQQGIMESVLTTLVFIEQHESAIREYISQKRGTR